MNDYVAKSDFEEFKADVKEEFKKHTGILLEGFQRSLGFVIDEQKGIERRLTDKIETTANGLRKEMKDMKQELKSEINGVRNEIIDHRDNTEVHARKARAKKKA